MEEDRESLIATVIDAARDVRDEYLYGFAGRDDSCFSLDSLKKEIPSRIKWSQEVNFVYDKLRPSDKVVVEEALDVFNEYNNRLLGCLRTAWDYRRAK
jgi:hypothetical protein